MPSPDDEEDDYMSMVIEEPVQQKETFTQRKRREQRESEARAKVPSKAERAAQEAARREEALATSTLDPSNKGFQMMAKLGFKPGESLGKRETAAPASEDSTPLAEGRRPGLGLGAARSEPLNLVFKEDRGGIGLDSEKKRKIREDAAEAVKKIKHEEGDYRDRVREERELRRTEAQVRAAQKVAERLDGEAEGEPLSSASPAERDNEDGQDDVDNDEDDGGNKHQAKNDAKPPDEHATPEASHRKNKKPSVKPTAKLNVLYRGLVREREERERDLHARHALQTSLPSSFFPNPHLPTYDDDTLERDDRKALGLRLDPHTATFEQELEEEDPELDAFNALDPAEKLQKLVVFLRETYRYCFWCKYRYETDEELEGCPGLTEEDHD
ncbi:uncharacterized protein PFLUO_LOCUS2896 [Penicillium psychrofluorescens]|uniref:uncharacterized protein n=1 Tax=Penicillium psychrofluorescens TaxID=3158075 RepID=UPI003CCCFA42